MSEKAGPMSVTAIPTVNAAVHHSAYLIATAKTNGGSSTFAAATKEHHAIGAGVSTAALKKALPRKEFRLAHCGDHSASRRDFQGAAAAVGALLKENLQSETNNNTKAHITYIA